MTLCVVESWNVSFFVHELRIWNGTSYDIGLWSVTLSDASCHGNGTWIVDACHETCISERVD